MPDNKADAVPCERLRSLKLSVGCITTDQARISKPHQEIQVFRRRSAGGRSLGVYE